MRHCAGRVQYWQCDNEPSNIGLLWAGTAPEYVAQLSDDVPRAVKDADPDAAVVLGGCGYDVLERAGQPGSGSSSTTSPARAATTSIVFDLHLYDEPARILDHIATAR